MTITKIYQLTIIIFLLAAVLTGCLQADASGAGMGFVRINIAGSGARTAFPDMTQLVFEALFTRQGGQSGALMPVFSGQPVELETGIYNIAITAKTGTVIVGTADIPDVEIVRDTQKTINNVLIKPVIHDAADDPMPAGTIVIAIDYSADIDNLDAAQLFIDANPALDIKTFDVTDGILMHQASLTPGSYMIRAVLTLGDKFAGNAEAVHIYSGMTTKLLLHITSLENEDAGDTDNMEPGLFLAANASSGSAYPVITAAGFDYESPSQLNGSVNNIQYNIPRILQVYDNTLQKNVFAFALNLNADRNATGDWRRQRVEIKIDHRQGSQGRGFCALEGEEGRSFIYRWKFKLPQDFAVSTAFTHIHQIKNEGGDASQPVISLTTRAMSGNSGDRRMQLIYRAPTGNFGGGTTTASPSTYLAGHTNNTLNAFIGEWVQCEEHIVYSSDPSQAAYSMKITRIRDNAVLMEYTYTPERYAQLESDTAAWPFVTWREGNTHGRPKFGLYRAIFSGDNPGNFTEPNPANAIQGLKDETILYADFEVIRLN